jgi:Mn-dependent DtxR family transcriptional regulator
MTTLLDQTYTSKQATYDLRRLRRKGLIERQPHSHRYLLTERGRRIAVLFTKTYSRVLAPGLAALDLGLPTDLAKRRSQATAWRALNRELEHHIDRGLAPA